MKLSPRLETIASFVERGAVVADIGTDHGYIPVCLVSRGTIERAVASDINEGPLNNAREYVEKNRLEDSIDIRLGGGLLTIKEGEVDTAIIAGMGGMLIADILEESKSVARTIDRFVLQPMVGITDLRKYLYGNGYRVVAEKLAKEGEKFYQIILVEHGEEETIEDEIYFEISKRLIEDGDAVLLEFLEHKIAKFEKILAGIADDATGKTAEKKREIESKRDALMEVNRRVGK